MAFTIDLSGKHALVTGGASGIGYGIALAFLQAGAEVTVTARTNKSLAACAVETPHGELTALRLDVTNDLSIEEAMDGIDDLDILVNGAGTVIRQGGEFRPDRFADVINTNLIGVMRMCHECMGKLALKRGCILNIGSMFSYYGAPHAPAYGASKTAVISLTKSLAIAWAEHRVRINAIAPGYIETKMTAPIKDDETRMAAIMARSPMKRWGTPDEIGAAAVFLCSPAASFITGAVLNVDGGFSCV
jgi:NAD(P)-dependent dehydrogenase (short-subunit alcohol dehydrogenase family)